MVFSICVLGLCISLLGLPEQNATDGGGLKTEAYCLTVCLGAPEVQNQGVTALVFPKASLLGLQSSHCIVTWPFVCALA